MAVSVGNSGRRRSDGRTGCAVEATLSVMGGVWKRVLPFHLLGGTLLQRALPPDALRDTRIITLRLREVEADGIVARTVFPKVPPKVEDALTLFGRTLEPVLLSMRAWGLGYQRPDAA